MVLRTRGKRTINTIQAKQRLDDLTVAVAGGGGGKWRNPNPSANKLTYMGSEASEEYVETDYYKDLNCVDKQHHTTGTGFIKVENENANGNCFCLDSVSDVSNCHGSCKGNPATNEWIPTMDTVIPVSEKPNRSEN
ncbi:uncharacterized protein LOC143856255 isoform X2 [Tasmannia lanceolata]|uniref:uncharacterized protein LOC143856255 isoform X2 n=1 Tax=Tasmannia lanceolata TaxID=3420 RepID=UPI0040647681